MIGPYELDTIIQGDARDLAKEIPDGSIDLIYTDPPYLRKYIPLYGWLARESARILKPEGFLLTYVGAYWKDTVLSMIAPHMDYYFDFILINGGKSPVLWQRKIISRHKSIMAFSHLGSKAKARCNVLSVWNGGGSDKRFHEWGQEESADRYYIDCFSKEGDIVLDPFAGGGTVPWVCKQIGRRFLAFEIDWVMALQATERVTHE